MNYASINERIRVVRYVESVMRCVRILLCFAWRKKYARIAKIRADCSVNKTKSRIFVVLDYNIFHNIRRRAAALNVCVSAILPKKNKNKKSTYSLQLYERRY